ncbi:hypothetical protein PSTT_01617 [Puccinia striiformis]|uniref:TatD DNase n=1 Tax=Puccinia striiformis TaxID=27350 RepID=A0A2S4W347_9BASI|nr:hypothetical protein PSTT_01617 [Puccinia striiformis]
MYGQHSKMHFVRRASWKTCHRYYNSTMTTIEGTSPHKFIDIGSNLGDPIFRGEYHGKQAHPDDFEEILARAKRAGVVKQILTGDCLKGSKEVRELALQNEGLYSTVGCHPCRANEFESNAPTTDPIDVERSAQEYLEGLDQLIAEDQASGKRRVVVAVGECGLDYDRLSHASKETQLRHFHLNIELHTLGFFFDGGRTSEAHQDFIRIIKTHQSKHEITRSFTDKKERSVLELMDGRPPPFHKENINISLKTEENLEVVKAVPLDRIMLETDCPWCEIRPSHASHRYLKDIPTKEMFIPSTIKKERHQASDGKMVKGRNEPCTIGQVAWVVSQLKGISFDELINHAWKNSIDMFGLE